MADKQEETPSESTSASPVNTQPQKENAELTEEELGKVSGGLAGPCATGKHIDKATLTP